MSRAPRRRRSPRPAASAAAAALTTWAVRALRAPRAGSLCVPGTAGGEPARLRAAGAEAQQWVYKDPQGKEQGPYPAHQLVSWSEQGYFPSSLQARARPCCPELCCRAVRSAHGGATCSRASVWPHRSPPAVCRAGPGRALPRPASWPRTRSEAAGSRRPRSKQTPRTLSGRVQAASERGRAWAHRARAVLGLVAARGLALCPCADPPRGRIALPDAGGRAADAAARGHHGGAAGRASGTARRGRARTPAPAAGPRRAAGAL